MLVNDELYLQTFCKLLEAVVKAGGLEVPVENLQKNHFYFLSRKINAKASDECGIKPATIRDYRYIYRGQKKFSVKENRLDILCDFIGFNNWIDFRNKHCSGNRKYHNGESAIKLLILPDKRYGETNNFEGQLAELIVSRYEDLKFERDIDSLEILYEDQLSYSPTGIKKTLELAETHQADIVVWPEYLHGEKPMMRIPFLLVNPLHQKSKRNKLSYQKIEGLAEILEGTLFEELDMILFSMLGKKAFERDEIEKAKNYFSTVLAHDYDHKEANYFMNVMAQQKENAAQDSTIYPLIPSHSEPATFDLSATYKTCEESTHLLQGSAVVKGSSNELSLDHHTFSTDKHLLVLKGDNRVLMTKNLEPLVRSTLIHEDEPVFFLTTHTDLELMSMKDLNVFHVEPSKQEVLIKDAIVAYNQQKVTQEAANENQTTQWFLITANRSKDIDHILDKL